MMQTARCPHCHRQRITVQVHGAYQFRTHTATDRLDSQQCKGSGKHVDMVVLRPLTLRPPTSAPKRPRTRGSRSTG